MHILPFLIQWMNSWYDHPFMIQTQTCPKYIPYHTMWYTHIYIYVYSTIYYNMISIWHRMKLWSFRVYTCTYTFRTLFISPFPYTSTRFHMEHGAPKTRRWRGVLRLIRIFRLLKSPKMRNCVDMCPRMKMGQGWSFVEFLGEVFHNLGWYIYHLFCILYMLNVYIIIYIIYVSSITT